MATALAEKGRNVFLYCNNGAKLQKKGTRVGEIDEEAIASAIREVLDKTLSIRKSAEKYGIKATTLENRITKLHKKATTECDTPERSFVSKYSSNQVFTTEEETTLNKYITDCSKMHYGLTLVQVRRLAYELAKANNLRFPQSWHHNKMAGKDWLERYRQRNTNLSLRKPENTSAARSYGFNKTAVNAFFQNPESIFDRYKFTGDRIYNFYESGISKVLNIPKVLAEKTQKQVGQLVSAERRELVTFGGIISASGNTIPPLFVFPRVHFKDHFIEGAPEGSLGVTTKSGWMNSNIFLEVLKHIKKHTICSKHNTILLLCDNHESHVTIEAINYARDNGIVYLSFPPRTTHRVQPLDVGIFGLFKSNLKVAFNDWHVYHPGKTLNIYNIPKLARVACFESFNGKNITNAFEKTGIWPFNKLSFSDDDFAPVQVYQSISTADPDTNIVQTMPNDTASDDPPLILTPASPSLLSQSIVYNNNTSSKTLELVTPEMIRPYPKVNKNAHTKSKKGRQLGKSRIYTDSPEKNRLEEIKQAKKTKRKEQERKNKANGMKRVLHFLSQTNLVETKKKEDQRD